MGRTSSHADPQYSEINHGAAGARTGVPGAGRVCAAVYPESSEHSLVLGVKGVRHGESLPS